MSFRPFCQVVNCFASFKGGKAWGDSKLCSDFFKRFPLQAGQVFYPLVLKSFARVQPPLQWKGGGAVRTLQGKGRFIQYEFI